MEQDTFLEMLLEVRSAREDLPPDVLFQQPDCHRSVDLDTAGQSRIAESNGRGVVPVDRLGCWVDLDGTGRTQSPSPAVELRGDGSVKYLGVKPRGTRPAFSVDSDRSSVGIERPASP